jgi:hypothetical protein
LTGPWRGFTRPPPRPGSALRVPHLTARRGAVVPTASHTARRNTPPRLPPPANHRHKHILLRPLRRPRHNLRPVPVPPDVPGSPVQHVEPRGECLLHPLHNFRQLQPVRRLDVKRDLGPGRKSVARIYFWSLLRKLPAWFQAVYSAMEFCVAKLQKQIHHGFRLGTAKRFYIPPVRICDRFRVVYRRADIVPHALS